MPTSNIVVDEEISRLRAELQRVGDDNTTITALSTAIRRRFFLTGDFEDFKDSMRLLDRTPRPTLEDIGTASISFHPLISSAEKHWVQWQPWLESQGYMLSDRYHPGWTPSWGSAGFIAQYSSSDNYGTLQWKIVDAVRIKDGERVFLKVCSQDRDQELHIAAYFSSEPRRSDPRNHCSPLLDVLRPPILEGYEVYILVNKLLRPVFAPEPETVGELLTCIAQLAEGLAFLHENHTAHLDIHYRNVMMDASHLIPGGWHPWNRNRVYPKGHRPHDIKVLSRSAVPVHYYYIDFNISRIFSTVEEPKLVTGLDRLNPVPEQSETVPYDPFAADMRMFGDMLKHWSLGFRGLGFLGPFIAQLTWDDPSLRPTASQMHAAFVSLQETKSKVSLTAPLRKRSSKSWYLKVRISYLLRVISNTILRRP